MTGSNAMAAKARAMFGERLKASDYQTLLQKKSVPEIAGYLKTSTCFSTALEGINDKAIHRGQLEALLRTDVFNRLSRLLRYSNSGSDRFIYLTVMETEISLILMCIRSFTSDEAEDRIALISRMPIYVEHYMTFNIRKLAEVKNFEELQEVLKGTMFYDTVHKYSDARMEEIDYAGLEHEMNLQYYSKVLETIDKAGSKQGRQQMREIYLSAIELDNIAIIYRLKKYFQASPDSIRKLISPQTFVFSEKQIQNMIECSDADEVIRLLQASKYKRYISSEKFSYIEHYTNMISFNMNYHFIEFYTDPNLVLLSYMLLSECEIRNVVDIIEGVRYGISADRIKMLLIY